METGLVGAGGVASLVSFAVLAVYTGRLIPRRIVDDIRADRDARIKELQSERDEWKRAFFESEKARSLADKQTERLLVLAETTDHFIRSLPNAASRGHR